MVNRDMRKARRRGDGTGMRIHHQEPGNSALGNGATLKYCRAIQCGNGHYLSAQLPKPEALQGSFVYISVCTYVVCMRERESARARDR